MNGAFLKTLILNDLADFKAMSAEEYILYQKWEEVNLAYPRTYSAIVDEYGYDSRSDARLIPYLKNSLWNGKLEDLQPELIWIGDKQHEAIKDHWTALRILIHSQQHSGAIGRCLNYLVRDKTTKQYIGLISIASDFLDLTARDKIIGWSREQRTQEQRIKHTAVCSTIVPVQPFGYNMLGGKLLALLCLSNEVTDRWQSVYGDRLVGLTTTSLYGKKKGGHGMSQYDNLPYWNKMGYSTGSAPFKMKRTTRDLVYAWAEKEYPEQYRRYVLQEDETTRDRQNRFIQFIYRELDISPSLYKSSHDRGIYFAPLYANTNEFLCDKIKEEELVPTFDRSISNLGYIWMQMAAKRYNSLERRNSLKTKSLFYDNLALMSWKEAKTEYLQEIGR